jgi:hypothetical protein
MAVTNFHREENSTVEISLFKTNTPGLSNYYKQLVGAPGYPQK